MRFLKQASFLEKAIDDAASRLTTVKEIVDYLQDVRTIVTLTKLKTQFPGTRIPIDELCSDVRVESSLNRDKFKFIPEITRQHGVFVNDKHQLLTFLTKNPTGIRLYDLRDAYKNIDKDVYLLEQSGLIIVVDAKEWKNQTKEMSAEARARKEKQLNERVEWEIVKNDPRVLYPASKWLIDETLSTGNDSQPTQTQHKCVHLWHNTKTPPTMAEITEVLKQNKHEVLPDKASR
jgi:hypothetical protein